MTDNLIYCPASKMLSSFGYHLVSDNHFCVPCPTYIETLYLGSLFGKPKYLKENVCKMASIKPYQGSTSVWEVTGASDSIMSYLRTRISSVGYTAREVPRSKRSKRKSRL